MARTQPGEALTEAHRLVQIKIITDTVANLARLWVPVDPTDIRGTLDPITRAMALLVLAGRRASAQAALSYYATFRAAEGVPGEVGATTAPEPWPDTVQGGLFGAAALGIMNARRRGADVATAKANGLVQASGAAVKVVANGGRETILGAILKDPEATGYQRITDGAPCAFCRMIASKGIVAHTEASAGFKAHGHCGCTAEPAYEGSKISPLNATFKREWNESTAGRSGPDALKAYRAHLKSTTTPATG